MQVPNDQKRKKIVHDFAKWTAMSALRSKSPIKTAKAVYNLIEKHAKLGILFDLTGAIDQTEFDHWHEKAVLAFGKIEPALQVGWAAKIINVYLKARVYLAGDGRVGLASAIHPPIDSGMQRALKQAFPGRPWKIKPIKEFCSYEGDYLPFIQDCRTLAEKEGCLPIELDWFLGGAE